MTHSKDKVLTQESIRILYDKYLEIMRIEINELGCKPTEVRHLLGRLGEFYCALKIGGTLARDTNQHGFDVTTEYGERVSVKTTAQKSGFVTINPNTLTTVDTLMLLQYLDDHLEVIYYGSKEKAVEVSRSWGGKYELDISKARNIV